MCLKRPLASMVLTGVIAALLASCNQSVSALETRSRPEPLPSVPLAPIETTELDPAVPSGDGSDMGQPLSGDQTRAPRDDQMASIDTDNQQIDGSRMRPGADSDAEPLSREALAGTWIVESDNPDCRIILAFTKWSGGYRAATRRCDSTEISAITAWDVEGSSVILVDGNGQKVASLYSAGPERYDGSTAGGDSITFTR